MNSAEFHDSYLTHELTLNETFEMVTAMLCEATGQREEFFKGPIDEVENKLGIPRYNIQYSLETSILFDELEDRDKRFRFDVHLF